MLGSVAGRRGGLGGNATRAYAPPPAQMAGARAGPAPRFRARVSAARGPQRPRPINRQAETPSCQSRPGPAAPALPRPLFPLALVALSAPSGPCDFWPARTRLCARACVQASPWPCTLMCPQLAQGPRERLAKAPEKLLGEDEL